MEKIKKNWNKHMKLITAISVMVWLVVLFFRSVLHVTRIYREFTEPVEAYYPDVYVCGPKPEGGEKLMYYTYINLGEKCEK